MDFPAPLIEGTLLSRYKRFFADVRLPSGDVVTAHCANPGSMLSVREPGARVWLSLVDNPSRKLFTVPTALSLMVFFALCCQCASTLAVIRRETRSWRWPLFTFTYMTVLAYVAALVVYQVGSLFS